MHFVKIKYILVTALLHIQPVGITGPVPVERAFPPVFTL